MASNYGRWRELRIKGGMYESVFIDDYLNYLGIQYKDVRDNDLYRAMDIDFIIYPDKKVEIKKNSDMKNIYFQEYKNYSKKKLGWLYTSKADMFVFIFSDRSMIFLNNTTEFKIYYKNKLLPIKKNIVIMENSVYRKVPIGSLYGFIAKYHRIL